MALLSTFYDDFSAPTLDTIKWGDVSSGGGAVAITGGRLALSSIASGSANRGAVLSAASYTALGSDLTFQVTASPVSTPATGGSTGMQVRNSVGGQPVVQLSVSGTVMTIARYTGGTTVSTNITYSPATMAWWRVAFPDATSVVVYTGPDGVNWTTQGTYSATVPAGDATRIYAWNANSTAAGTAYFDNFNPAATWYATGAPTSATDPDTPGAPTTSYTPLPASLTDGEALGTPDTTFVPGAVAPGPIDDIGTIGAPTLSIELRYRGGYGEGRYGDGLYGVYYVAPQALADADSLSAPALALRPDTIPASISDGEQLGAPALGGDAVPAGPHPLPLDDPETLDGPSLTLLEAGGYGTGLYGKGLYGQGQLDDTTEIPDTPTGDTNYRYGAGTYGEGIYYGLVGAPTDTNPRDNPTYGSGTYGYGIYYGEAITVKDAVPLFADIAGQAQPALHILGIGPWSPVIHWRGAANYGIPGGNRPARPALALPAASSKGFTLRLNDGCEARADLNLPRGSALIIDEMDTDLWWRRKDPRTKKVEIIGRFNTSHVNTSTNDSGLNISMQCVDYRTLLGDRMILRYLHPGLRPDVASQWPKGTKITDILAWAIPTNMRLDLTEITGDTAYPLGVTNEVFVLPPGTTLDDMMESLNAVSGIRWEWWIDTPDDINQAPRLRFILGTRGLDKGVVLFDLGKGPSPIAAWTRNAAADNYANSLFYQGGSPPQGVDASGGIVQTIPAQIVQYGQRDAQYSNSTVWDIQMMRARARAKLETLANRQPGYTITLAAGFWRGRSHIDIGDTITLVLRLGHETLREKHRVTEIDVDIDTQGAETVTLTLGTPPPAADPRSRRAPLQRLVRYLRTYVAPQGAENVITEDT